MEAVASLCRTLNPKVIFALFLVHFSGDFYGAFINPLLPVLADTFSLTLAQVGVIAGVSRVMAFVVQPSVGYLADRAKTRFFILGGPLLSILCIPLTGVAPDFWLILVLVALGSIGSSMYHPTAAGMVSGYAGNHIGLCMSIFWLGGTMAFGLGPLVVTGFVTHFGLQSLPYTSIFGLVIFGLLVLIVPAPESEGMRRMGFLGTLRITLGEVWRPLALIWVLIVIRSYTSQSFMVFGPVLFTRDGHSLLSVGAIVALYDIAGALSGVLFGHLSDRLGFKSLFYVSYLASTPALLLFLHLGGWWVYPAAFLSGFNLLATMPLSVILAQELAPQARSMVSSLMMGLAFGVGGVISPLTGHLADLFSIRSVLTVIALIPLASLALIPKLPDRADIPALVKSA